MAVNRWPDGRRALRRGARQAGGERQPERFVELGLRNAQIFEVQLEDVDGAIARYRRVARGRRRRTSPPSARSIGSTRRPSAGRSSPSVLAREAEIGQSPDEILELKYRLGQVQQTPLGNLDAAIAAYRDVINAAPEHQATLEALEALFASGREAGGGGRDPRAALPLDGRVGEARRASTRRSWRTPQGQDERLAAYYRLAELFEEKLLDPAKTLDVYIRALKEFPLDEKAGEEAPRLAGAVDGGWETLANAYADVLGVAHRPERAALDRARASRARSRTSSATSARPRRRTSTSSASTPPTSRRSPTSIASTSRSSRGRSSRRSSRCASRRPPTRLELVELYARLGELYETRLADLPNAIRAYRPHLRRARQDARGSHRGARAHLRAAGGMAGARRGLPARARERLGRLRRGGHPRQDRAPRGRQARLSPSAPSRPGRRVLDLRGEDPEALHALANLYESHAAVGQAGRHPRARVRHRASDEDRVDILHAPGAHHAATSSVATTPRSTTGTASSTSTTRTSPRCAPSPTSGGARASPTSS